MMVSSLASSMERSETIVETLVDKSKAEVEPEPFTSKLTEGIRVSTIKCVPVVETPSHVVEFEREATVAAMCTSDIVSGDESVGSVCCVKWGRKKFNAKILGVGECYYYCI